VERDGDCEKLVQEQVPRFINWFKICTKNWPKFLCTNFSIILLPKFQTSTVNRRRKRKFKARTARALAAWSYYRFLQRLLQKSGEYPWCRVITVNEAYTSKTCGMCGQINYKLGERKIFCCLHCKMRCDRDVDGARNILLRFLSE